MMITIESLRAALVANMGRSLMPDVLAEIELAAIDREDRAVDISGFAPLVRGDVTFAVERFSDIQDELDVLHRAQWLETEAHRRGIAFNPDYAALLERERVGQLVQFTARVGGSLVGNIRMYIGQSLHTQTLFAEEDTWFVLPEYRKGMMAIRFCRYAEQCLESLGVREVRVNTKIINRVNVLVEYMKYRHVANNYVKILGGTNNV